MTLLSKLQHPAIVKLYDLFEFDNRYMVVMEFCKGGPLNTLFFKDNDISEKVIISVIRQLLSALSYMHSLRIVHRDIKL